MGIEALIVALIAFMLLAALIAVETHDLLSAVISVGAAGFALSTIDLLLGAPDLAITQVVVEIIVLVVLVRLVVTRTDTSATRPEDALRTAVALLGAGVILVAVFVAVGGFSKQGTVPPFGQPVFTHQATDPIPPGVGRDYLNGTTREIGSANAVMSVVLDYRGYDTLGEATVIFVSIMGAYAMLRKQGRKKEPASP
jgi:multisubunit Na+/H+ antiporter MnhB subunit